MVTTPNYLYNLPVVGGDFETWGGLLNFNTTKLDTDLKAANDAIDAVEVSVTAVTTNANGRVLKIGDTMTGALILPAAEPTANTHAAKKQYVDNGELSQTLRYLFSTGIGNVDPGAGKIGVNDAVNARDATRIYVSTSCANGKITPLFANFVDGVVLGLSRADKTIFYRITSAVNNTDWYTLTVVALSTIPLPVPAANAAMLLTFLGFSEPEAGPVVLYTDYLITTWALSSVSTVAHGLGHTPSDVRAIFKCKNAVNGYGVGDLMYAAVGSNNERGSYAVSANSTNVFFSTAARIYTIARGGNDAVSEAFIGTANWDVILRVWP